MLMRRSYSLPSSSGQGSTSRLQRNLELDDAHGSHVPQEQVRWVVGG